MKTACVLVLAIGWTGLMYGRDHADTPDLHDRPASAAATATRESDLPGANSHGTTADSAQDPQNGEHSYKHRDSRQILGNRARSHVTPARTKIPLPAPRVRSGSATTINLPQSGSSTTGSAELKGLVHNGTIKGAVPVRPSNAVRPDTLTLSHVRHRSPNPAVIGGSVNWKAWNAGEISGRHMEHRH